MWLWSTSTPHLPFDTCDSEAVCFVSFLTSMAAPIILRRSNPLLWQQRARVFWVKFAILSASCWQFGVSYVRWLRQLLVITATAGRSNEGNCIRWRGVSPKHSWLSIPECLLLINLSWRLYFYFGDPWKIKMFDNQQNGNLHLHPTFHTWNWLQGRL